MVTGVYTISIVAGMMSTLKAAEILGICRQRVHVLCVQGRIPAKQVGRNWVVLRAVIKPISAIGRKARAAQLTRKAPVTR